MIMSRVGASLISVAILQMMKERLRQIVGDCTAQDMNENTSESLRKKKSMLENATM